MFFGMGTSLVGNTWGWKRRAIETIEVKAVSDKRTLERRA